MNHRALVRLSAASLLAMTAYSSASTLYTQGFDSNDSANWNINNNANGTNAADIFYDYSTVGIPSAPHSTGGSTRGIKLSANISGTGPASGVLPGISVSPTGQSFTGDYTVRFDWWHNFIGGTSGGIGNAAGGSGSTQLSTFGILSSGTVANYAGSSDGLFYGATGDGASAADFRVYSSEATSGYTVPNGHNNYAAGSTNSSAALYQTLFPAGASAPSVQQTTYASTQTGSTVAGMAGFRWHDVQIVKSGTQVFWYVDGTLLTSTETAGFTTPTAGSNILFGMSDTSLGAGTPAATFAAVDFTLIDNVIVTDTVPEPTALSLIGIAGFALARRRKA